MLPAGNGACAHTPSQYGSFNFPTPPLAGPDIARREADLAQREAELTAAEQKLVERPHILGFEIGALRKIGRPLWRDSPPQWQPLCRRLWQLWVLSLALFAWNWMLEVYLSLLAGGEHYIDTDETDDADVVAVMPAASAASSSDSSSHVVAPAIEHHPLLAPVVNESSTPHAAAVPPARMLAQAMVAASSPTPTVIGGQVGAATLLLLGVPTAAWLGWCHPLTDAALSHGTADSRAGLCGVLALGAHVLLCGVAVLGPPGCGLAGLLVALVAARAGYFWAVLMAIAEALGFLVATLAGIEVYRRVLRSSLFVLPGSRHATPHRSEVYRLRPDTVDLAGATADAKTPPGAGAGGAQQHVAYGRI